LAEIFFGWHPRGLLLPWLGLLLLSLRRRGFNGGLDLSLDPIERQKLQFPFRRRQRGGRVLPDGHLLFHGREAQHLDFNCPCPVREIGKGIQTLEIGDGDESLIALRGRNRCAGNRQSAEGDFSPVLRSRQD
jgi:hypothetical protein